MIKYMSHYYELISYTMNSSTNFYVKVEYLIQNVWIYLISLKFIFKNSRDIITYVSLINFNE